MKKNDVAYSRVVFRRRDMMYIYKLSFWYLISIIIILSGSMLVGMAYNAKSILLLLDFYILIMIFTLLSAVVKNRKTVKTKRVRPY